MSGTQSQAAAAAAAAVAAAAGQGERGGGGRGRGGCFSTEEILSYTAAAVNIAIMIHLTGKCKSALMRKQSMLLPFKCFLVLFFVKKVSVRLLYSLFTWNIL